MDYRSERSYQWQKAYDKHGIPANLRDYYERQFTDHQRLLDEMALMFPSESKFRRMAQWHRQDPFTYAERVEDAGW